MSQYLLEISIKKDVSNCSSLTKRVSGLTGFEKIMEGRHSVFPFVCGPQRTRICLRKIVLNPKTTYD